MTRPPVHPRRRTQGPPGQRVFILGLMVLLSLAAIESVRRPVRVIDDRGEVSDPVNQPREMWSALPALRIDVNSASVHELRLLPGVGETLARYIGQAREAARFESLAELDRVHRIGPRTIERLAPFASIGELHEPMEHMEEASESD